MENKEFYIMSEGMKLHAIMEFPEEEKETYQMAVVLHGLSGYKEEPQIEAAARAFRRMGMASLRVDLYGHGKSEGTFYDHNMLIWLDEILDVLYYAKNLDFVSEIYLAGHSQGGLAAILAAGMAADQIKALIPMAPALIERRMAQTGDWQGWLFDVEDLPESIKLWKTYEVSTKFVRVCKTLPIEQAIEAFKKPVAIIHSDTDESVPFSDGEYCEKLYADARLINIPGTNHLYSGKLDELEEAIITFVKEVEGK